MSIQSDGSVGVKKESSYGTGVTVDHFLEVLGNPKYKWDPKFAQGKGLRAGRLLPAAARRVLVEQSASGDLTVELATKGMGVLLEGALGAGVSTMVAGTTYQQVFTLAANDFLPSYTHQVGVPTLGGAVSPHTYTGGLCSEWELSCPGGDIATLKTSWMFRQLVTATALATPSYPAGSDLFHFAHGTLYVGGTLTMPTSIALGSCTGTPVADIRDFSIKGANGLDSAGFNMGGAGLRSRKQALGGRSVTGKMTAEYDSNVLRDAYLNQSDLSLLLTLTSAAPLSTGFASVQVAVPVVRLEGEVPNPGDGGVITQSIDFTALDNLSTGPIAVVIRTAEATII